MTTLLLTSMETLDQRPKKFTCLCCSVKFESVELQRTHFKSEWHRYNLRRKVCNLGPVDLDGFNQIQALVPRLHDSNIKDNNGTGATNTCDASGASTTKHVDSASEASDDDEWEEVESDDLSDEEYDEDDVKKMLAAVVACDTCLFCDKKSSDIKKNVIHMNLAHGFFIPEEQYLIDLEGFMEYLGFKVGAGATCLWCKKQFTTKRDVRLHMLYKDHCKVLYDQEKAVEFKEFYDYSTQEHFEMKPIRELVVHKRKNPHRTDVKACVPRRMTALTNIDPKSKLLWEKNYKKFNAFRNKTILRTNLASNQTARGRIRPQNPI